MYKNYIPKKIDDKAGPNNSGMWKTKCAGCGNPMFTYAKDKLGTLPVVFCTTACEANKKYDKKFDVRFK